MYNYALPMILDGILPCKTSGRSIDQQTTRQVDVRMYMKQQKCLYPPYTPRQLNRWILHIPKIAQLHLRSGYRTNGWNRGAPNSHPLGLECTNTAKWDCWVECERFLLELLQKCQVFERLCSFGNDSYQLLRGVNRRSQPLLVTESESFFGRVGPRAALAVSWGELIHEKEFMFIHRDMTLPKDYNYLQFAWNKKQHTFMCTYEYFEEEPGLLTCEDKSVFGPFLPALSTFGLLPFPCVFHHIPIYTPVEHAASTEV